ncbi:hypothetical protein ACFY36_16350 [Actinoplanes sp. NPDC000266]
MPLIVRFRLGRARMTLLARAAVVGLLSTVLPPVAGAIGPAWLAVGGAGLALLAVPILLSVFRVPVLRVDEEGMRLALAGVRLSWADIDYVTEAPGQGHPVVLIVPKDVPATLRQMRPWSRAGSRKGIAKYGTPLVLARELTDEAHAEILPAVARFRPALTAAVAPSAGPAWPVAPSPGPGPGWRPARTRRLSAGERVATIAGLVLLVPITLLSAFLTLILLALLITGHDEASDAVSGMLASLATTAGLSVVVYRTVRRLTRGG